MQYLKQSSGTSGGSGPTISIGPCLDSTGAEFTTLAISELTLTKNGTSAAMAANATLTHTSNGHYDLVMIGNNVDTLGRLRIRCNKSGYQIPPLEFMVLPATVFDALVTNATTAAGGLGDIQRMAGTTLTGRDIGASVLLSSGTGTGQVSLSSGLLDITQTAADKAWLTATRVLTAGTNIALAKGTGLTGLNDIAATAIVSGGAITTSGGKVSTVTTTEQLSNNNDKSGYSLLTAPLDAAGTRAAVGLGAADLDTQLNAIYTVSGLVKDKTDNIPASPATEENVTSVGTAVSSVYTNLGLPSGAATISAMIVAVKSDTSSLLSRITSTLFSGITSLANWLGALAGKTPDTATRAEINATTAGEGFNETTDSMQALRDNYTTGGDTISVAPLRAIVPTSLIPISGTLELFQYGPLPYGPITLVQGDGVTPINVSARNLKLIMVSNQNPTTVGYELTSLGEQLVVTGTDSNLVGIVAPGPTYTSVAGDFTWNLRDADTDEGLAWGIFRIMAMANAAPS